MSIYFDPHGHQLHLRELEASATRHHYDHSRPPLTGWRAERKAAEMARPVADNAKPGARARIQQIIGFVLGPRTVG